MGSDQTENLCSPLYDGAGDVIASNIITSRKKCIRRIGRQNRALRRRTAAGAETIATRTSRYSCSEMRIYTYVCLRSLCMVPFHFISLKRYKRVVVLYPSCRNWAMLMLKLL